jgi:hypothetical protein
MSTNKPKDQTVFNEAKEFYRNYLDTIVKHGFFPKIEASDVKKRGELSPQIDNIDIDAVESNSDGSCDSESRGRMGTSPFGIYQYDYNFAQWGAWSNTRIG